MTGDATITTEEVPVVSTMQTPQDVLAKRLGGLGFWCQIPDPQTPQALQIATSPGFEQWWYETTYPRLIVRQRGNTLPCSGNIEIIQLPGFDDGLFELLVSRFASYFTDIAGIGFDLDGTLIDVSGSQEETCIRVVAESGSSITKEDIVRVRSMKPDIWDITYLLASFGPQVTAEPAAAIEQSRSSEKYLQIVRRFQEIYRGTDATPGLIVTEKLLIEPNTVCNLEDAGFICGIATGRPRDEALIALRLGAYRNWGGLLENCSMAKAIVALGDYPPENGKPDPTPLLLLRKKMDVKMVYVGDTESDAKAANAANMPSIIVCDSLRPVAMRSEPPKVKGATCYLKDVNELPKWWRRVNQEVKRQTRLPSRLRAKYFA